MRRFIKWICIFGMMSLMLTGCNKEKEDPIRAVYTSIEAMSYEEALEQLSAIEADRGNRQELSRLSGICYMGLGQYDAAVEALETALSYNDGFVREVDYDINQYLAAAYYNLGKFEEAEQVCLKNNFRLVKYQDWVDYAEYLAHLPLLRSANHEKLLSERSVQQIHHQSTYYYFRVTDMLKAGEPMPLFMAKDKILRILTNRRQGEIIRNNEERIRRNANENGLVKLYIDTVNIN